MHWVYRVHRLHGFGLHVGLHGLHGLHLITLRRGVHWVWHVGHVVGGAGIWHVVWHVVWHFVLHLRLHHILAWPLWHAVLGGRVRRHGWCWHGWSHWVHLITRVRLLWHLRHGGAHGLGHGRPVVGLRVHLVHLVHWIHWIHWIHLGLHWVGWHRSLCRLRHGRLHGWLGHGGTGGRLIRWEWIWAGWLVRLWHGWCEWFGLVGLGETRAVHLWLCWLHGLWHGGLRLLETRLLRGRCEGAGSIVRLGKPGPLV